MKLLIILFSILFINTAIASDTIWLDLDDDNNPNTVIVGKVGELSLKYVLDKQNCLCMAMFTASFTKIDCSYLKAYDKFKPHMEGCK